MRPPGEQIGGNIPGPTYVCQVCGQAFWGTERDILMLLPGHLESNPCKQARRRARWRAWLSTVTTRLRELVFGRTVDHVISVPMDPVELTTPGPTDLVEARS